MKLETAVVGVIELAGKGISGKTLFHTHMPAGKGEGVLVLSRVPVSIDPYTGLKKGTFQVITRSTNVLTSHSLAVEIMKVLETEGAKHGEVDFKFIKPQHEPLVFPRTDGGQFEASVNYNFAANWE